MKKMHPADLAAARAIDAAVSFNVHVRTGPFDVVNVPCATLRQASEVRIAMLAEGVPGNRRPCIYAIGPGDAPLTHHVPEWYLTERLTKQG